MPHAQAQRKKTRILVADRESVFRLGLKQLFGVEDDMRVVAEAETAAQVVALARTFRPDVLFVQAEIMAEGRGAFAQQVRRVSPSSRIVVTASGFAEDEALRHVKNGAQGVILKSVGPVLFIKSVRKVMADELWLPKRHVAQMAKLLEGADPHPTRPVETLTPREKTIISCLTQGWRNREIARHLSITEQTVKNHLRTVYDKVGVSDRLELVLYAIHKRLELPPITPAKPL